MTRHKHADVMIAYANDSSLVVQMRNSSEEDWEDINGGAIPAFFDDRQYRIKPKKADKGDFICEIDGKKWYLGPEAPQVMTWDEAKEWVEKQGCFLPPREVLLMCYIKEDIRKQFEQEWYWSMDECKDNPAAIAWFQTFNHGHHIYNFKTTECYVRGVFCEGLE